MCSSLDYSSKIEPRRSLKQRKVSIMSSPFSGVGEEEHRQSGVGFMIKTTYGLGNCYENGRLLLQFCSQHQLTITNTLFQQQDRFKTTRHHPRSKHWHLMDYILVCQRDTRDAAHTSHAQCRLLHRPQTCTCKACIHFQATSQEERSTNQETPGAPTPPTRYRSSLPGQASGKAAAPTEPWPKLTVAGFQDSSPTECSRNIWLLSQENKDWFDESDQAIQDLLDKKRSWYNHLLFKPDDPAANAAYKKACSTLQASLRTMQNDWWEEMADKTQLYADLGLTCAFFEALKAIYLVSGK